MAQRNDVTMKIDPDVLRDAKIAAAFRGQSLAEFASVELGKVARQILHDECRREMQGERTDASVPVPGRKRKGACN